MKNNMYIFDCDLNTNTNTCTGKDTPIYIPLISITKDDLKIRPDVMLLLQKFDIDYMDIISIQNIIECTMNTINSMGVNAVDTGSDVTGNIVHRRAKIILVDHNYMSTTVSSTFIQYIDNINRSRGCNNNNNNNTTTTDTTTPTTDTNESKKFIEIVEILDHHVDLLHYLDDLPAGDVHRSIAYNNEVKKESVGSCCTLIAEQYMIYLEENRPTGTGTEVGCGIDSTRTDTGTDTTAAGMDTSILCILDILDMLLGVILLDTCNMSVQANRGSQRDQDVICRLLTLTTLNKGPGYGPGAGSRPGYGLDITPDSDIYIELTNNYFKLLSDAKTDLSFWYGLSISQCMKLDYKSFYTTNSNTKSNSNAKHLSISSMVMPISMLLLKPNINPTYNENWNINQQNNSEYVVKQELLHEIVDHIESHRSCLYAINTFYNNKTTSNIRNKASTNSNNVDGNVSDSVDQFQRELLLVLPIKSTDDIIGFDKSLPIPNTSDSIGIGIGLLKTRFVYWFSHLEATQQFEFQDIPITISTTGDTNTTSDTTAIPTSYWDDYIVCLFRQNGIKYSRKQLAPMLQSVL